MRKSIIAAVGAAVAASAVPVIMASPSGAMVQCGPHGAAPDAAACAQYCAMIGESPCQVGPPVGGPPPAPVAAPPPATAAPPPPPAPPVLAAPPPGVQSPGPVATWPSGVAADCVNAVYAAHFNMFCATAPGGPYPLGSDNPYENGTPLDNPALKPGRTP